MANTPEQTQYDADLAALNGFDGAARIRAKESFDLKYPNGRPKDAMTDASIASGLKAATNLGIGEALLSDPTYGAELKKVFERFAPKNFASCAEISKSPFRTPWGTSLAIPFRTVNSAKKIGAWARIGKHEAKGFVLCSL